MAIIRINEIRKLSKEDREKRLTELKVELSKLMATKAMGGSLENPGRIRLLKKTIARIHTVSREEELGIARKVEEKKPKAEKPAPKEDAEKKPEEPKEEEAAPAEAKPKAKRARKAKVAEEAPKE